MRSVLAIAAEDFEFAGILKRCQRVERANWGIRFGRIAELNGMRMLLAAHGPGPKLAGAAADAVHRREQVDAVVSTGLCGALEPGLVVGEVVVAEQVNGFPATLPATPRPHRTVKAISIDRVVIGLDDREHLRTLGASIVEMEADAVAQRCAEWRKPFYCVRSVSDIASEEFLLDFNRVRDADGRFRRASIIGRTLMHPFKLVPEMLRLKGNSQRAAESLGDFVATCCF